MNLTIEFTGLARQLVGQKQINLEVCSNSTYAQLVQRLGSAYPDLIGSLIASDGRTFLSSNMFIINGDMALPALVMDESPCDGDRLVLVSVITGG